MGKYSKTTWYNNITKVNATNMNHIEEGIYENANDIEALQSDVEGLQNNIETIEENISEIQGDIQTLEQKVINYHSITYAELKVLKNNNELIPNDAYRITDYVTKVNGKINNISNVARSAEHPFDIVVYATSTNTFSEEAFACLHEGDTYFAEEDLESWKLWYCFENDTNRFEWADTENGKGVIYRMIDEFDNDIPYDFKNVQFKRYKITGTTDSRQEDFIGKYYAFNGTFFATYDTSDFQWYYTCNDVNRNDLSIQNVVNHAYGSCRYVKQLKIGQYLSDEPNYRGKQALNDIVLISPSMIVDLKFGEGSTKNTLIGNEDMTYSYFGEMCRRNIICGELSHNRCDECFEENLIGTGISTDDTFHFVRTGRHFANNIIIKMTSTTFKDAAYDNIFATKVTYCTFSSLINNNDYSNLEILQYCDIQRSYNTKIYGSGKWLFVKVKAFESCEIHIDNLYGSTFGFLQRVKLSKNINTSLNIVSMEFDTILGTTIQGSSAIITIINLSDLEPYNINGSKSFKRLCGARIDNVNGNKFEYTCENIEDGMPKVLGAYSIDDGANWQPLKNLPDKAVIIHIDEFPYVGETGPTSETVQITSEQVAQIKNGAPIYLIDSMEERIVLYLSHFIENDDVVYRSAVEYPYDDTATSGYYYIEFELHSAELEAVVYAYGIATTEIPKLYRHLFRGTCLVESAMHTLYFEVTNTNPDSSGSGSGPHIYYNTATVLKEVNECGYINSDYPLLIADTATTTSLIYSEVYQSTYRLRIKPAGSNTFSIADLTILGEKVVPVL